MDADADANRPRGEASLGRGCCLERGGRSRKGDEEPVTGRVDLDAAVLTERFAQEPTMLLDGLAVGGVAELLEQPRRAFDVREEEGDRPGRKLARGHASERNAGRRRGGTALAP
jgi:hypothetical protein